MTTFEPAVSRKMAVRRSCQVASRGSAEATRAARGHVRRALEIDKGDSHGGTAPPSLDHVLAGFGTPLQPALRHDMEQRFGHDFSGVRVHSGPAAERSACEVNATAYTAGEQIVFGAGRFAPGTHEGRRLIAHELTHVVQQRGDTGRVQRAGPAGGCAEVVDMVDEQRDEASWAGFLAHLQIQKHFYPLLHAEADMPRATKDDRRLGCPAPSTEPGRVDLWHYDGAGGAQIGEIKSVNGAKYAAPEVSHYRTRFEQLIGRMTGGTCVEKVGDERDVIFDEAWLNGDVVNDRQIPQAKPLDSIVPTAPTPLGGFIGNPNKPFSCERRPDGAVVYWCGKEKDDDDNDWVKQSQLAKAALRLGEEAARRYAVRKAAQKVAEQAAFRIVASEGVAAAAGEGATLVAGGGAAAAAAGAVPVVAMVGVFVALGSGYAAAREAVRDENTASGFAQGFVMGLLGWEWHHAVDRFGRRNVIRINPVDEATDVIRVNAYNRGLRAGYVAGSQLPEEAKKAYLSGLRRYAGPRVSTSWTREDQISRVIELAAAARIHFLTPE